MKKNNAGITLISLVITIIILIILSSIAVYSGVSTVRSAKLTEFTTEMKMMQQKVNELYDSYANNKTVIVGGTEYVGKGKTATESEEAKQGIQEIGKAPEDSFDTSILEEIFSTGGSGITDRNGYRYYNAETIRALGLENMEYEFFVNVEKRSVVSVEGFKDSGKNYYTLEQLPDGVYNVDYNRVDGNLSFDVTSEIRNGQGKIHLVNISYDQFVNKWQVRYRLKAKEGQNENAWTTTEDFTGNEVMIDVPIENIFEEYEVQIIHGEEIVSEVKETQVLQIGDYVDYDPTNDGTITTQYISQQGTYHSSSTVAIADTNANMKKGSGYSTTQTFSVSEDTGGWRVFGIDKETNEILLISADTVKRTDNENFYLRGQTGYEWGIKELNDICKIFGQGQGASGARSITVEDINQITGYDPAKTGNGEAYGDGNLYEYGNEVTYTKNASNIGYKDTLNNNDSTAGSASTMFRYYDRENNLWKTLETGESAKLTSTYYYYYPRTLTTSSSGGTNEISDEEYEILFKTGQSYWLASSYVRTYSGSSVYFGLNRVYTTRVYYSNLCYSTGSVYSVGYGVRPIVSLKSTVSISGGAGTEKQPYQIQ